MRRWIVAAAIPLVIGVAIAACSDSASDTSFGSDGPCPSKTPPSAQDDADMSVEELTDLVAEAITCPGYAFHMRSAGDTESGPYSRYSEIEVWTDMHSNVERQELLTGLTSDESLAAAATAAAEDEEFSSEFRLTRIVRSDATYSSQQGDRPPGKGRAPSCHGPGREALGLVLPCSDGPLEDFEFSIETNTSYKGQSAIAYVSDGESRGSDETYFTTTRNFFDEAMFLPLGQITMGTLDIGEIYPIQADIEYQHEFVPLNSLPDDFFDPASIGYVGPDPGEVEKPLDDAEIAVYWIGREFEGSDEYPALALDRVFARPRNRTPEGGSVVEMTYRPADDEFGRIWVRIEMYSPEAWAYREEISSPSSCTETVEFELAGATALVTRKYHDLRQSDSECPPHDRFSAEVHFQDVVVEIDAPATSSGREVFHSPYDSEEGMELLIRSLELRE